MASTTPSASSPSYLATASGQLMSTVQPSQRPTPVPYDLIDRAQGPEASGVPVALSMRAFRELYATELGNPAATQSEEANSSTITLPQMNQSATGLMTAEQTAYAKAAEMLHQAQQNNLQDMQQTAQDIALILEIFATISQSATSQQA